MHWKLRKESKILTYVLTFIGLVKLVFTDCSYVTTTDVCSYLKTQVFFDFFSWFFWAFLRFRYFLRFLILKLKIYRIPKNRCAQNLVSVRNMVPKMESFCNPLYFLEFYTFVLIKDWKLMGTKSFTFHNFRT